MRKYDRGMTERYTKYTQWKDNKVKTTSLSPQVVKLIIETWQERKVKFVNKIVFGTVHETTGLVTKKEHTERVRRATIIQIL